MATVYDLEGRVRSAAHKVESIGEQAREAGLALRRAILSHKAPGVIEDMEVEVMLLGEAMSGALAEHFAATIMLSVSREQAQRMEVA